MFVRDELVLEITAGAYSASQLSALAHALSRINAIQKDLNMVGIEAVIRFDNVVLKKKEE